MHIWYGWYYLLPHNLGILHTCDRTLLPVCLPDVMHMTSFPLYICILQVIKGGHESILEFKVTSTAY